MKIVWILIVKEIYSESEAEMRIGNVDSYVYNTQLQKTNNKTAVSSDTGYVSRVISKDSAVADFINRHPGSEKHVKDQVNAGKKIIERSGAGNIDRDSMTMEEYKRFFTQLMDSIPFDSSQWNTSETWSITEDGWKQMKNDPDYEAWVLGYTKENRSVRFPKGLADAGTVCIEKFGASIDEHHGVGFSKSSGNPKKDDDESWWTKRHKKQEEILKEQAKKAQSKRIAQQKQQMEVWEQQALESRQRMAEYFNSRAMGTGQRTGAEVSGKVMASAMEAYDRSIIDVSESGIL